jgi:hypothetical protein
MLFVRGGSSWTSSVAKEEVVSQTERKPTDANREMHLPGPCYSLLARNITLIA